MTGRVSLTSFRSGGNQEELRGTVANILIVRWHDEKTNFGYRGKVGSGLSSVLRGFLTTVLRRNISKTCMNAERISKLHNKNASGSYTVSDIMR